MSEPKTCGGYCCEKFRIGRYGGGYTYEDLRRMAETSGKAEDKQIFEMVIPLGLSRTDSCGDEGAEGYWYTCKHFNLLTRLCNIYETRPDMCRTYNVKVGQACGLSKCQLPPPPEPKYEVGEMLKKSEVPADGVEPSPLPCQSSVQIP